MYRGVVKVQIICDWLASEHRTEPTAISSIVWDQPMLFLIPLSRWLFLPLCNTHNYRNHRPDQGQDAGGNTDANTNLLVLAQADLFVC